MPRREKCLKLSDSGDSDVVWPLFVGRSPPLPDVGGPPNSGWLVSH